MGLFSVNVGIGKLENGHISFPETAQALVDCGATYSTIPASLLKRIGAVAVGKLQVKLADGTTREKPYTGVWLNIEGRPVASTVLIGDENDLCLLGATSLEQAGFMIDPIGKRLIPVQAIQALLYNEPVPF